MTADNFRIELQARRGAETTAHVSEEAETFILDVKQRDSQGRYGQQLHIVGSLTADGSFLMTVNNRGSKILQNYEYDLDEPDLSNIVVD